MYRTCNPLTVRAVNTEMPVCIGEVAILENRVKWCYSKSRSFLRSGNVLCRKKVQRLVEIIVDCLHT